VNFGIEKAAAEIHGANGDGVERGLRKQTKMKRYLSRDF